MEEKLNENNLQLIHLTRSLERLKEILESQCLYPSYCDEKVNFNINNQNKVILGNDFKALMVSFTGNHLRDIIDRKIDYGNYGIAFKNDWVRENKILEVNYINQEKTDSNKIYKTMLESNIRDLQNRKVFSYLKNTDGKVTKKNEDSTIKVVFTEEKEFRYIPDEHCVSIPIIVWWTDDDYQKIEKRSKPHVKNEKYSLRFNTDNIEFILVNTMNEVSEIKDLGSYNNVPIYALDDLKQTM